MSDFKTVGSDCVETSDARHVLRQEANGIWHCVQCASEFKWLPWTVLERESVRQGHCDECGYHRWWLSVVETPSGTREELCGSCTDDFVKGCYWQPKP